jgi:Type IV secretion system pilin
MKQKIVHKAKYFFPAVFLVVPFLVRAQSTVSNGLQTSGLQSIFGTSGLNGSQSLSDLIVNVIRLMLLFAGAIAVVFVIIGGYQYIASGGNEETAEKGKKTLINAIIGVVVIVLAYAIINVIVNLVGSGSGYGF